MTRIITAVLVVLFMCVPGWAFPLKYLEKGAVIPVEKFSGLNRDVKSLPGMDREKVVLLWRHDKRTSLKTVIAFLEVCEKKGIACIAVNMQTATLEQLKRAIGEDVPENVVLALDSEGITESWGVFTLPVTLFLDENNAVVDAIGYEGQYVVRAGRMIDLLKGDISREEFDRVANVDGVDRRRSLLPDLNFIIRLIDRGQADDASERLAGIDVAGLTGAERTMAGKALILLGRFDEAVSILQEAPENDVGSRYHLALAHHRMKKYDEALEIVKSIEGLYPDRKSINYLLGSIHYEKGEYQDAATYFNRACDMALD